MINKKLEEALLHIDWSKNISDLLNADDLKNAIANSNYRIAIWSKQLEQLDHGNPALTFVREMQISGQQVAALIALGLYKPASSSIRSVMEAALYYTYFRTHEMELNTLVRNKTYWITKEDVVDFHKIHSLEFHSLQTKINLIGDLQNLYKTLSSIVHGQIPGVWSPKSFKETRFIEDTAKIVSDKFEECTEIVHRLFLCTVGQEHWDSLSPTVKKILLKGMSAEMRKNLKLDEKGIYDNTTS